MRLRDFVLAWVVSCAMVLPTAAQSPVRAEQYRTAANALLCASPLTIKEAYQATIAGDRKWLQKLNCIQAKAGLQVTVIERNPLGWRVRVNVSDQGTELPQAEHTALIGRAERKAEVGATNRREAKKTSDHSAKAFRHPVNSLDGCCMQLATQETSIVEMTLWGNWLEFRATDGSYLDSEGRPLKKR